MNVPQFDLRMILPEITIAAAVAVVMVWAAFLPPDRQRLLRWVSGIGLLLALGQELMIVPGGAAFGGMYVRDALTKSLQIIVVLTAILAVWLSGTYVERTRLETGEYYALLLSAALGAMLMAASTDLLLLFLGLETLSIPLYVLAAIARRDLRSQEAGMKYFLLGAFSTVFFLYGLAFVFGAAGSTSLSRLASQGADSPLLLAGIGLLTIGLAFKAAVVPFHAWAPDVYEGAPLPVTAYMSVISKIGAFAAMLRVFVLSLSADAGQWGAALAVLSVMTMVLGNVAALLQSNLKRLLAYSSIAHAGFILTGIVAANRAGTSAVVFYLLVYAIMAFGAFAVLLGLARRGQEADDLSDLTGLAWRSPALAGAMTLFMVSLAGLPPTAGFLAKLYVFSAALDAGYTTVVIVAVLTSVVSAYYYLRVAYTMFIGEPAPDVEFVGGRWISSALVVTAAGVLLLGIVPAPVTTFLERVASALK